LYITKEFSLSTEGDSPGYEGLEDFDSWLKSLLTISTIRKIALKFFQIYSFDPFAVASGI